MSPAFSTGIHTNSSLPGTPFPRRCHPALRPMFPVSSRVHPCDSPVCSLCLHQALSNPRQWPPFPGVAWDCITNPGMQLSCRPPAPAPGSNACPRPEHPVPGGVQSLWCQVHVDPMPAPGASTKPSVSPIATCCISHITSPSKQLTCLPQALPAQDQGTPSYLVCINLAPSSCQ